MRVPIHIHLFIVSPSVRIFTSMRAETIILYTVIFSESGTVSGKKKHIC